MCFFFFLLTTFKIFSLTLLSRYLTVIFLGISVSLCCFCYAEHLKSVILCLFPNLGLFWPLFLQTFSSALVSFPWRTPMMWMLDLLILPHGYLMLCFFLLFFSVFLSLFLILAGWIISVSLTPSSLTCLFCLHSAAQFTPGVGLFVFLISDSIFFSSKIPIFLIVSVSQLRTSFYPFTSSVSASENWFHSCLKCLWYFQHLVYVGYLFSWELVTFC